jgi:hypothetical protein
MEGMMAALLKTAVKKYLRDRYEDRFDGDEYELLANEFKHETTNEEFTALRKSSGDERREVIRAIALRIQARVRKEGTKEEKDLMKRFMKAREETTSSAAKTPAGRKRSGRR